MRPYIAGHGAAADRGAFGAGRPARPARRMARRARRTSRAARSPHPEANGSRPPPGRESAGRVPRGGMAGGEPARVHGRAVGRAPRARGRAIRGAARVRRPTAGEAATGAHLHRRVLRGAGSALHHRWGRRRDHAARPGSRRGLSPGRPRDDATGSGRRARMCARPPRRTGLVTSVGTGAGGRALPLHVRARSSRDVVDRRRPARPRDRAQRRARTPVHLVESATHR